MSELKNISGNIFNLCWKINSRALSILKEVAVTGQFYAYCGNDNIFQAELTQRISTKENTRKITRKIIFSKNIHKSVHTC
jgi:hypothetical protein